MWQIRAYETSKSHGFSTHNEKIFHFYLRQNVSKSIITFPKWHKYVENIAKNPGVASGASLPKRATALFGGRDPLRFSGISLKILRFWEFPKFIFLRKWSRGYQKFKSQQKNLGNEVFRTRSNFCKKKSIKNIQTQKKIYVFYKSQQKLEFLLGFPSHAGGGP